MFVGGVARAVASSGVGPSRPQAYGKQVDEVDEDPEIGKPQVGKQPSAAGVPASPHLECDEDTWTETGNADIPPEIRAGFIRKVYGILAAQMTLTCAICAAAMLVPPVRAFFLSMMSIPYAQLAIFVPALGVLCALQAKKDEHPTNYRLLWTFTVLMSLSIAGICAIYQQRGLGYIVLQAFAMTAACFIGLSLYAMKSGKDFEWMGGMLSMGLMGLLAFSFLGMIFGFHGGILFSLFGVVLFCGYIVYDTHRLMRIHGPDDAIVAAVELYLDILNLFLYMLELLSAGSNQ